MGTGIAEPVFVALAAARRDNPAVDKLALGKWVAEYRVLALTAQCHRLAQNVMQQKHNSRVQNVYGEV